jgi:hypothetical protein
LKKVINSERAAMYAPDFIGKLQRTRKELLHDLLDNDLSGSSKVRRFGSKRTQN